MASGSKLNSLFAALSACVVLAIVFGGGNDDLIWTKETYSINVSAEPVETAPVSASENVDVVPLQLQLLPWGNSYLSRNDAKVRGLAIGYSIAQNEVEGLSLSLINSFNARKSGVSVSGLEMSGESNGLSMFLAGGMVRNNGLSMGLLNMAEFNSGVQFGLINQAGEYLSYTLTDQAKADFGVQAGVVNYSNSPGVQFGLWNTNPNSLIKHFPFFNICL